MSEAGETVVVIRKEAFGLFVRRAAKIPDLGDEPERPSVVSRESPLQITFPPLNFCISHPHP